MTVLERDLVTVTGPDAFSFLQSMVSQDVEGMADREVRASLLLTPKGKVASAFRVVRVGDDVWLDVEAGHGDALREALERFKLRVKVELAGPTEPWGMVAVRDGTPVDGPGSGALLPTAWSTGPGIDVIGPRDALDGATGLTADEYERLRIEAGVPRLGFELDESTIPQEAGLEGDAISFTKGCFLGQELVARIDSRGHVNRMLRRLRPDAGGDLVLVRGADVEHDGKAVGAVTSSVPGIALGYVRHEVEPGTTVTVAGTPATVEPTA